jgi:hypothetical protein
VETEVDRQVGVGMTGLEAERTHLQLDPQLLSPLADQGLGVALAGLDLPPGNSQARAALPR